MKRNQKFLLVILISVCFAVMGSISVSAQSTINRFSITYGPNNADPPKCLTLEYITNEEGETVIGDAFEHPCDDPSSMTPLDVADLNESNVVAKICIGTPRTDLRNCTDNLVSLGELVANENPYIWFGGRLIYY